MLYNFTSHIRWCCAVFIYFTSFLTRYDECCVTISTGYEEFCTTLLTKYDECCVNPPAEWKGQHKAHLVWQQPCTGYPWPSSCSSHTWSQAVVSMTRCRTHGSPPSCSLMAKREPLGKLIALLSDGVQACLVHSLVLTVSPDSSSGRIQVRPALVRHGWSSNYCAYVYTCSYL